MTLKDQLSLSRNGGVYYEGTRVKATDDPVLFIGLGGTGADALLRVKNEVQTRMNLPKDDNGRVLKTAPNNFGFLVLDTDQAVLRKTCGVAGFDENGDELVQISVPGLPSVIENVVTQHITEPQWNWYDKELTANGGIDGANGIRQIGRFMLFWNAKKVKDRFDGTVRDLLRAATNNNQSNGKNGVVTLRVFILTGIGGGTGSGTFLDVAYLIRSVAQSITPNVQIHGYIFTPDLNRGNGGDERSMYRNGFAALKELDYWMSAAEHRQPFVQDYPGNYKVYSIDKPFDYCHIITAQDAQHHQVSYYEALDAVGSSLFSYVVEEKNLDPMAPQAIKSMYDNISSHIALASGGMPYAANYSYLSVGSSQLEIPYTEITTLLAARVFEMLEPVFQRDVTKKSFERNQAELRLTYDDIKGFLCSGVSVMPITGRKYQYKDIWPNNGPYKAVYEWLNGHAQIRVRENQSNFVAYAEGRLRPYLTKLIGSAEYGPCYAARLIYANTGFNLINTLHGYAHDCRERMSESRRTELRAALETAFAEGREISVLRRSEAVKKYMEALTAWIEYEYMYWVHADMASALDAYADRLEVYRDRIFRNLHDSLMILPGVFRENVALIAAQENAAQNDPTAYARYLIRPMQFEREYRRELEQKAERATGEFLATLSENLDKFVGVSMDEVDQTVTAAPDVSGFIAQFINSLFSDTLTMNIEALLKKRIPAGTTEGEYYRNILNGLQAGAVPMYHTGVAYTGLTANDFALISIPEDCPNIFRTAKNSFGANERPKSSAERSKIHWVKIQAGMPLYAFPEVAEMEKEYEQAMQNGQTRPGVHLRWEWREKLPSPLPEETWAEAAGQEKTFTRDYNARIRAAFDKCYGAEVIRKDESGDFAWLYVAKEDILDKTELHGSVRDRLDQLEALRNAMWGDTNSAIRLNPFGNTNDGREMIVRARENVLRFYNVSAEIVRQAELYAKYERLQSRFTSVQQYVKALFADLIYEQGFERKFRRAKSDFNPVSLFDLGTDTRYEDYESYKAFSEILTEEVRNNIAEQYEIARGQLLNAEGGFNVEAVETKRKMLDGYIEKFADALQTVKTQIERTRLDQRESLIETKDFYERAIELLEQTKRMLQGR